jgi:hypothetical protein
MKRVLSIALGVAAVAFIATGCTSTHVSQYSAPLEVKVKTEKPPTVEVGDKIQGEATIQRVLCFSWGSSKFADGVNYSATETAPGLSFFGDSMGAGKAAAAYNACVDSNADVIIVPRYTIEDNNYFVYQKTKFNVVGFKGTLKNVQK